MVQCKYTVYLWKYRNSDGTKVTWMCFVHVIGCASQKSGVWSSKVESWVSSQGVKYPALIKSSFKAECFEMNAKPPNLCVGPQTAGRKCHLASPTGRGYKNPPPSRNLNGACPHGSFGWWPSPQEAQTGGAIMGHEQKHQQHATHTWKTASAQLDTHSVMVWDLGECPIYRHTAAFPQLWVSARLCSVPQWCWRPIFQCFGRLPSLERQWQTVIASQFGLQPKLMMSKYSTGIVSSGVCVCVSVCVCLYGHVHQYEFGHSFKQIRDSWARNHISNWGSDSRGLCWVAPPLQSRSVICTNSVKHCTSCFLDSAHYDGLAAPVYGI